MTSDIGYTGSKGWEDLPSLSTLAVIQCDKHADSRDEPGHDDFRKGVRIRMNSRRRPRPRAISSKTQPAKADEEHRPGRGLGHG
jgi:hypothetical protein